MGIFFRSEHTRATAIVAIALTFCATISRAAEPDTQYVIVTALGREFNRWTQQIDEIVALASRSLVSFSDVR
jgi:hypothetical protein